MSAKTMMKSLDIIIFMLTIFAFALSSSSSSSSFLHPHHLLLPHHHHHHHSHIPQIHPCDVFPCVCLCVFDGERKKVVVCERETQKVSGGLQLSLCIHQKLWPTHFTLLFIFFSFFSYQVKQRPLWEQTLLFLYLDLFYKGKELKFQCKCFKRVA